MTLAPARAADVSPKSNGPSALIAQAKATGDMTLDDIEDVAITLQHIRLEAIGIFVEATRKKTTRLDTNTLFMSCVPRSTFEDQKLYLPLRKGWLTFFIGTMEPLVHILNEELTHLDEAAERNAIPADRISEWHAIVKEWTTAVHGLDAQLDVCARLLDEPSSTNVEVAKSAQAIDEQVSALDKILVRASKLDQEIKQAK
jgi:hypothetical protein